MSETSQGIQEPPRPENTSSFERFLINWIDTDKLDSYMGIVKSNPSITSLGAWAVGFSSPPQLLTLEDIMRQNGQISRDNQRRMYEFKDHLLDYVMYIFSYYGMNFTHTITTTTPPEKQSIFITYGTAPNGNTGSISKKNYDKIDEPFKILALRLSKIYKIITKYIIGFHDLSQHSVRKDLLYDRGYHGPSRVIFPTHHRMIFILGELYENQENGGNVFNTLTKFLGWKPSDTSSPGQTQDYSGGKHTKRKRIRKSITQKKRASRLSSSL